MKYLIILVILFSIGRSTAQNKNVDVQNNEILTVIPKENGKIENGYYVSNLFDWKILIPDGYEIIDPKRFEELENKGYAAAKNESNGIAIDPHPNHLIGFGKGKYDYFKASYESLAGKKKFTLEEHKKFCSELLENTYSKIKELKFEITTSDLKIGDYDFYKIQIRVYSAKTEVLLLTQEIYNSYINNHLFSASINYMTEEVGHVLNYNLGKSFENGR